MIGLQFLLRGGNSLVWGKPMIVLADASSTHILAVGLFLVVVTSISVLRLSSVKHAEWIASPAIYSQSIVGLIVTDSLAVTAQYC
jgi:hypothetical protein